MNVTLEIPDEVLADLPVPAPDRAAFLRLEAACGLYARDVLSLGRAAELAGIPKFDFGLEVGRRGIPRHYTAEDLEADIAYARGQ